MSTEMPGHATAKEEFVPRGQLSHQQTEAKLEASEQQLAKIEDRSRRVLRDAERASDVEITSNVETAFVMDTQGAAKTKKLKAHAKADMEKKLKAAEQSEMQKLADLLGTSKAEFNKRPSSMTDLKQDHTALKKKPVKRKAAISKKKKKTVKPKKAPPTAAEDATEVG